MDKNFNRLRGKLRAGISPLKLDSTGSLEMIPFMFQGSLKAAAELISQLNPRLLSESDAQMVVYNLAQRAAETLILEHHRPYVEKSGRPSYFKLLHLRGKSLAELIPTEKVEVLADELAARLLSFPIILNVTLPFIGSVPSGTSVELAPDLHIVEYPTRRQTSTEPPLCGIRVTVKGFPTLLQHDTTVAKALERVCVLIGVWRSLGYVDQNSSVYYENADPSLAAIIVDPANGDVQEKNSGRNFAKRSAVIRSCTPTSKLLEEPRYKALPLASLLEQLYRNTVGRPLAGAKQDITDFEPIASACHWLFEGAVADNETTRFIALCVGVEAIVGDSNNDVPLGQKIADRVAYLLEQRPTTRKAVRERVESWFRVRGKIVHGRIRTVTAVESTMAWDIEGALMQMISREFTQLLATLPDHESRSVYSAS